MSLRLKELRLARGWTQHYVATLVGVKRSSYAHYERGYVRPAYPILQRLARAFHTSIEALIEDDQPSEVGKPHA